MLVDSEARGYLVFGTPPFFSSFPGPCPFGWLPPQRLCPGSGHSDRQVLMNRPDLYQFLFLLL